VFKDGVVEGPEGSVCRTLGKESMLRGVDAAGGLEVGLEAGEQEALKCLAEGAEEGDRAVGGGEMAGLVGFGDGESETMLPSCGKITDLQTTVQDGAKEGCDDVSGLVQAFVGDAISAWCREGPASEEGLSEVLGQNLGGGVAVVLFQLAV